MTKNRGKWHSLRQAKVIRWEFAIPAGIIILMVFAALFADWLMPHDPYKAVLAKRLSPPFWLEGGSISYPLGTDTLGRDILSRLILGARVSLIAAVLAITVGGGVGTMLGIAAGYFGKRMDAVIMRISDGMLAFPSIFLALLLAVSFGPSFGNVVLVIALVLWARFARVLRGEALSWKTRDFVDQAKIVGASSRRILFRHILPNVLNTAIVMSTLQVGFAIMLEASLSFLGAGIPPPTPSWGGMTALGRDYVATAWWISIFPGLAIFFTVLSLNLLGDWLRDTLDPKLRQV